MFNIKPISLKLFSKLSFAIGYLIKKNFSEKKLLQNILNNNSVVIDVGSNIGLFIELLLTQNKNLKIYSIEPNEKLINYQIKKFKQSNNISYHQEAISDSSEMRKFYIRNSMSHSSLNKEHFNFDESAISEIKTIKTITLIEFISNQKIKTIDLLKLDTEGLELDILKSIKSLLLDGKIRYLKVEVTFENLEEIMSYVNENNLKIIGFLNIFHLDNKFNMMDVYIENCN